jgi:hypothetical protein
MEQHAQDHKALYPTLDPESRQIRLFTLQPGTFGDPIQGFLSQVSLDDEPDYEALSYVWGDPEVTLPISLSGNDFGVTTNLESALRHLRLENDSRRLWIDAICINQSDISERNHQVKNMKLVYQAASRVLTWQGNFSIYSQRGLKLLSSFMTKDQGYKEGGKYTMMKACIDDILDRDYWQRIWIVQEVTVAKCVLLVCGPFSVELPTNDCYDCTVRNQQELERPIWMDSGISLIRLLRILRLREDRKSFHLPSLWGLAFQFHYCRSRDPRDMVFALLGLVSDSEAEENKADYALTTEDVIYRLVRSYILRFGNLHILNCVHIPSNAANDPSRLFHRDESRLREEQNAIPLTPFESSGRSRFREFRTANTSQAIIRTDSKQNVLTVQGFVIDTVDYIGPSYMCGPCSPGSIPLTSGVLGPGVRTLPNGSVDQRQSNFPWRQLKSQT